MNALRSPDSGLLAIAILTALSWRPDAIGQERERRAKCIEIPVILTPRRKAVLSAQVQARVTSIRKELGESFEQGERILTLDRVEYEVQRSNAEAAAQAARAVLAQMESDVRLRSHARKAEASLGAARANLEATERLYNEKRASRIDFENAKRDVEMAVAECELVQSSQLIRMEEARKDLRLAEGRLALADEKLKACLIQAPYSGRLVKLLVGEHELVAPGTNLIEIVDDRVIRAQFFLPSDRYRSTAIDQKLAIRIAETGDEVEARISHISSVLDPVSMSFEVYAQIDNRDGLLRAGMNGVFSLGPIETDAP